METLIYQRPGIKALSYLNSHKHSMDLNKYKAAHVELSQQSNATFLNIYFIAPNQKINKILIINQEGKYP